MYEASRTKSFNFMIALWCFKQNLILFPHTFTHHYYMVCPHNSNAPSIQTLSFSPTENTQLNYSQNQQPLRFYDLFIISEAAGVRCNNNEEQVTKNNNHKQQTYIHVFGGFFYEFNLVFYLHEANVKDRLRRQRLRTSISFSLGFFGVRKDDSWATNSN